MDNGFGNAGEQPFRSYSAPEKVSEGQLPDLRTLLVSFFFVILLYLNDFIVLKLFNLVVIPFGW